MNERIEGQGELENWERPHKRWAVRYLLEITTETVERPGLPTAPARKRSTGQVRPLAGEPFPLGQYRLYRSEGEILKLENLGNMWMILGS